MTITEKADKIREIIVSEKKFQFRNELKMSGWVLKKPTYTLFNNRPVCHFILFMIHPAGYYDTYRCSTFNKKVIDAIKIQEKVFAISCLCKIINTKNNSLIVAVSDAQISYILEEEKFIEEEN